MDALIRILRKKVVAISLHGLYRYLFAGITLSHR